MQRCCTVLLAAFLVANVALENWRFMNRTGWAYPAAAEGWGAFNQIRARI